MSIAEDALLTARDSGVVNNPGYRVQMRCWMIEDVECSKGIFGGLALGGELLG